eukprot:10495128-Ditylum_brightwellii.AAC.1
MVAMTNALMCTSKQQKKCNLMYAKAISTMPSSMQKSYVRLGSIRMEHGKPEATTANMLNEDDSGWQDEREAPQDDDEMGRALSDVVEILRASIDLKTHNYIGKSHDECFRGSEAVDLLTSLHLSPSRIHATDKLALLWRGEFIVSVSHKSERSFHDGARLYRFASRAELQSSHDRFAALENAKKEGTQENCLLSTLNAALDKSTKPTGLDGKRPFNSVLVKNPSKYLSQLSLDVQSKEQEEGREIADFCTEVEPLIEVSNRKYHLKTYEKCFVGSEAVSKILEAK